jgi:hypothetical protein
MLHCKIDVALQQKIAYISLEIGRTGRWPGGTDAPDRDKAAARGFIEIAAAA